MIFLFEQIAYTLDHLKKVLPTDSAGSFKGLPNGFVTRDNKLDGVGYLFNENPVKVSGQKTDVSDKIVFVLPKVFLDFSDSTAIAFDQKVPRDSNFKIDAAPKEFLSQLSLWVCSSIAQYRRENPQDNEMKAPDAYRFDHSDNSPTLIDVMNAMKLFYAENKNLFVFTAKNKHCGNNRIDWRRTVAHTQPFLQGDAPIYMELENKKKVFDLDDRLLVLYFSAMNYIEETFGFKMPHSEFYAPMRVTEFRRLLGHRGLMELHRIKHKYFADKFLKLYNIVKAFFEWGGNFSANGFKSEYLLTSKYNNVFETMIDKLVGDELPKQMEYLKSQKDNKEVDHLYKDRQLIFADEEQKIWFIGDSKYYKDGNDIEGTSVHKQFTYARNIIQYNINDLLSGKNKSPMRYRDELTEGYSVTPNFFIRGELPGYKEKSQFREPFFRKNPDPQNEDLIQKDDADLWKDRNRHFENRLFDRDTLLLQVYNVNFLYVLKAYTSKRSSLRDEFKKKARKMFRDNFLELLDEKYVFYAVWPKETEESFVNAHFRTLVGKICKPVGLRCLILALEKETACDSESEKMWKEIENDCAMVLRTSSREIWDDSYETYAKQNQLSRFDSEKCEFLIEQKYFDENRNRSLSEYAKSMVGAWYNKENVDLDRIREYLQKESFSLSNSEEAAPR
ncbi:MAG: LlaJI family restriction endonuclease [Fibrobacter sp.]|nr:LlaJI family restriction endonuclease [Fibrobacter sp.]